MRKYIISLVILVYSVCLFSDGVQPTGSGSEVDPYQIEILDNLLWLSTNDSTWSAHFIQTANINASETSGWNTGDGFSPIGDFIPPFTGNYDGQGQAIDSLYINRSGSGNIGLFGFTQNATIENLRVSNADITGTSNVGSLVGWNYDDNSITNCYSSGSVSGTSEVGGLVGWNENSSITDCHSSGDVFGDSNVGGLVGHNLISSPITNCYTNVNIERHLNCNYAGGLIGFNDSSTITDCYSLGYVWGNNYLGGLVGYNVTDSPITNCYSSGLLVWGNDHNLGGLVGYNANNCTITNCYSKCAVYVEPTGADRIGGLIGENSSSSIIKCYSSGYIDNEAGDSSGLIGDNSASTINSSFWDIEASGHSFSDGGTGKTTAEMKNVRTFTDVAWSAGLSSPWDFVDNPYDDIANDDYWDIDVSINDGYPYLSWLFVPDVPQNVIISISVTEVNITWNPVAGATSYKVYSSDDPYSGFVEDGSGTFSGESWNAPLPTGKKFYYMKAVR